MNPNLPRFFGFAVVVLACSASGITCGQNQSNKTDPWKELTGKWRCEAAWVQGQAMPKEVIGKMQLQMTKGRFVAQTMIGEQKGELAFVGNPSKRQLKISTKIPPRQGEEPKMSTMNCMYKFEKGMLVLVYSTDEKFPTEFKSTEKNKYLLVHYRKVMTKKTDSKKR